MKLYTSLLKIAAISAALLAVPMFAQTTANFKVDVPFAFQVGSQSLPAGEYLVKAGSGSSVVLILDNAG